MELLAIEYKFHTSTLAINMRMKPSLKILGKLSR
jgi:hypothetical protein